MSIAEPGAEVVIEGLGEPPAPEVEPVPTPDPPAPTRSRRTPSREATWDDVEKAREEEKNKLYERLKKAEDAETRLQSLEAERAVAEKERKKQEAAAEKAKLDAERERMDAAQLIESYRQEQEAMVAALKEEVEKERLLREREREFSELLNYKSTRMAEEGEFIHPRLRDFVRGSSPQEIDASIEDLKARSADLLAEVQATLQGVRAAQPGVSPTGAPATGPVGMGGEPREVTLDDLRNMSAEDYAANRQALHEAVRRSRRG